MEDILQKNSTSIPDDKNTDITDHALNGVQYDEKVPIPEDIDNSWRRWKCLICGYVYEGIVSGKIVCPKCGNEDPDKFDEAE